jgi:two-component system, LytTR family, response regulator
MNERLSVLIVDDEEKARELLTKLLEENGYISEIRKAASANAALKELSHFNPDLIFLDIKMPGKDGFAFLKDLKTGNINAGVVFVTAYDQFAIEAIHNHAFDYLLKPVSRDELKECINQYRNKQKEQQLPDRLGKFLEAWEESSKIRFSTRSGFVFIDPSHILYCEAEGNYSIIHLGTKQHMCSVQLGKIGELLPANAFIRLGRSLIVNYNYITLVDRRTRQVTFEKDGNTFTIKAPRLHLREIEKHTAR